MPRQKLPLSLLLLSLMAFSMTFSPAARGQRLGGAAPRRLITRSIDEFTRVRLAGNTRPEANVQNDRGAVSDSLAMDHMLLQLRRPADREAALEQFLAQVQTPNSANFHQWLTPEQFGERFGPAPEDIEAVTAWLQSHGFQVNMVYPSGMVIDFSGTAGAVREAFQAEIHNLEVSGVRHIGNMNDPQVPAALAPAIVGISSLNNFRPHAMHHPVNQAHVNPHSGTLTSALTQAAPSYTFTSGGATYQAVVPADLATIYSLSKLFSAGLSGQGQTIVVIEDSNAYSTADWTTFRSKFGLSTYTSGSLTTVHPAPKSGTNNCANPGVVLGTDAEVILDAEWASAAAPSAAIEIASCRDTSTTFGGLIALQNLINASSTPPAVVSISYGECEVFNGATANATYNAAYQQAVAEGVSVFVSSGDEGAASCDANATRATHGIGVSGFASTPYNVAVGGTDYGDTYAGSNSTYWNSTNTATFGSAKSYIPEIPWNDSCAGVLLATYVSGSGVTYGSSGFCNTSTGREFLTTASGSGGPSGCATGTASTSGVVSGTCKGYAKPSWQSGVVGNPADAVRDIPDVSLFAANGLWGHYFVFCWSDRAAGGASCSGAPSTWAGAGGTSFSSPILAGIQAIINQKMKARQGNPNPEYYKLAKAEYGTGGNASCNSSKGNTAASTCTFYDVTQGDMDVNCTGTHSCYRPSGTNGVLSTSSSAYSKAYGTTTGWDFSTGLGTVNAYNLVNNWGK
ncbi:MAG TPA: protease pro-enzyme activation domain-containing protein [Terriglobales bacterium]|nr:protease pro-enzyme activation domain-containing protein [Terriglobales bacterium]